MSPRFTSAHQTPPPAPYKAATGGRALLFSPRLCRRVSPNTINRPSRAVKPRPFPGVVALLRVKQYQRINPLGTPCTGVTYPGGMTRPRRLGKGQSAPRQRTRDGIEKLLALGCWLLASQAVSARSTTKQNQPPVARPSPSNVVVDLPSDWSARRVISAWPSSPALPQRGKSSSPSCGR